MFTLSSEIKLNLLWSSYICLSIDTSFVMIALQERAQGD